MRAENHRGSVTKEAKVRRFNVGVFEHRKTVDQFRDPSSLSYRPDFKDKSLKADNLHRQASILALSNSALTVLVIACAFFDNESVYYSKISSLQSTALRLVIIALSLVQIFLTLQNVKTQFQLLIVLGDKHPACKNNTASIFVDKKEALLLVGEILHLCIVMPPYVDYSVMIPTHANAWSVVSLSDIVVIIIILRLYHVIRFIYSQSPYLLPKAQFFTKIHGVMNSPAFIVTAHMNIRPFRTQFVVGSAVLILSGVLLHIFERSAIDNLTLYDGPWCIAITEFTIGYGEIVPQTDIGRIIAVGPGLLGLFTWSLVVAYATRELSLNSQQKKVTERLIHLRYIRTELRPLVVVFLQRWWRLKLSRRRKDEMRLRKMLDYKMIHDKFKAKFAKDLAGGTLEMDDQIHIFHKDTKPLLKGMKKHLRPLYSLKKVAGNMTSILFDNTVRLLQAKQAFLRICLIGNRRPHTRSTTTIIRHKRSKKRSSINAKLVTNNVLKRIKARLPTARGSRVDEDEDSPDSSLEESPEQGRRRRITSA